MQKGGHPYTRATRQIRDRLVPLYHSLYFPPAVIFVAIMIAAFFGWQAAKLSLQNDLSTAAAAHIARLDRSVEEHLGSYEQILHGGVGLLQTSDPLQAKDWSDYLAA